MNKIIYYIKKNNKLFSNNNLLFSNKFFLVFLSFLSSAPKKSVKT